MKRFIVISGVALAMLAGGTAALAATTGFNTYNASETFSSAVGSPKHPAPVAFHEVWAALGNNGHLTAPLKQIVSKVYGIKTNGGKFPTCTAKQINDAGNSGLWSKVCRPGSLIASGPVNSLLVAGMSPKGPGTACNPYLNIYNGGKDTQTFFFSEYPNAPSRLYECMGGGVHTGAAAAYTGYITQPSSSNHNVWKLNIPLPPSVSTSVLHQNLYASLTRLDVNYKKLTRKVRGKTVAYAESIGCKNGTRPYSFTFTAQNYQGQQPHTQTTTINHTARCS